VWLSLLQHVVEPIALAFEPQLVLVSAGFDAHRDDPLADCRLEVDSFTQMALRVRALSDRLGVPLGAVLEGGYDLSALARSCAATLAAFADGGSPRSVERHALVDRAAGQLAAYWPVRP
jgi:acetoin utilization deacetylase AcuC-like enzyme